MPLPRVSVVMPVYNSAKYLKESIESIINQTFEDFEFIIVDDGSKDESFSIIRQYASEDLRIRWVSRSNKGIVTSLNEAISLARGEYIARMDADDISERIRLQEQVAFLDANPTISFLGTHIHAFGTDSSSKINQIEDMYNTVIDKDAQELTFLRGVGICHPSVMFRKSAFDRVGGYLDFCETSEDWYLWLRAIKMNMKIANLPRRLLNYRLHSESKTAVEVRNGVSLTCSIAVRLDFLRPFLSQSVRRYCIWGAGTGGQRALEMLKTNFPQLECVGFIDTYLDGQCNGVPIFSPQALRKLALDYVFIATTPGRAFAEKELGILGLKPLKDYIWIV